MGISGELAWIIRHPPLDPPSHTFFLRSLNSYLQLLQASSPSSKQRATCTHTLSSSMTYPRLQTNYTATFDPTNDLSWNPQTGERTCCLWWDRLILQTPVSTEVQASLVDSATGHSVDVGPVQELSGILNDPTALAYTTHNDPRCESCEWMKRNVQRGRFQKVMTAPVNTSLWVPSVQWHRSAVSLRPPQFQGGSSQGGPGSSRGGPPRIKQEEA